MIATLERPSTTSENAGTGLLLGRRALVAAVPLVIAGCGTFSLSSLDRADGEIVTANALTRVNSLRSAAGLGPLEIDPPASRASLTQARRMAVSGQMKHEIGFGDDFAKRMRGDDVRLPAAENIASGQETLDDALLAWERSASHRRNMLGPKFRGLGVAYAAAPSTGRLFWAMVLAG